MYDDLERYARHLAITGWEIHTQNSLNNAHVFVAGAGGLGSPLLLYLAAAGIKNFTICDYDIVSVSNLNRQILYGETDTGKSKVLKASEKLTKIDKRIQVQILETPLNTEMQSIAAKTDLIIDCLDNFKGRFILNDIAIKTGKPFIHAGVSEYYGQITFIVPGETPCLGCFISMIRKIKILELLAQQPE